jgi:hypothetical protein
MIRYSKKITLNQQRSGQWRIDTDRGDQYLMTQVTTNYTPLTDWWSKQHQSPLRNWQMDMFVKELTRKGPGNDYMLWLVHKAGGGYNQAHDIVVMYHIGMKLWVFSTQEHHWLQPSDMQDHVFNVDDAITADLLKAEDRHDIYPILDLLNQYYDRATA